MSQKTSPAEWTHGPLPDKVQVASGTDRFLYGVWGSGPNDVFTVGDGGVILHFDGVRWSPMESGTTARLQSVWGSGPSDVFAVGWNGVALHYDGSRWNRTDLGTGGGLLGVAGSAGGEVFAVGGPARVHRFLRP